MILEEKIGSKIYLLNDLLSRLDFWRKLGDKIVFTNGCFDILHPGHIHLLQQCAQLGDRLIIGLNSDESVRRLKGKSRPVNPEQSRAIVLSSVTYVDALTIFEDDTPEELIHAVKPHVLAKGGDWQKADIVGGAFVESYGGIVTTIPYLDGHSTTAIIGRM